jgi:predicted NBD/HSP70 family sugar kinase
VTTPPAAGTTNIAMVWALSRDASAVPARIAAEVIRPRMPLTPDEEQLLAMARAEHRPAQRALIEAGRLVGRSVASLTNVLNPAVVVVGGRFAEAGPFVIDGIRESLMRHCSPSATADLTVVASALGRDAEVLGAIEAIIGS